MDRILTTAIERVLERFVHEGLLLHNRIQGRRRRIRLEEVLEAGRQEPRLLELLPAILRLCPGMIARAGRNLKKYADLKELVENLNSEKAPAQWQGIPVEVLRKHENRLRQFWLHKQSKNRWRNINIRVSEKDLEQLAKIALQWGEGNKSETIRRLIANASKSSDAA